MCKYEARTEPVLRELCLLGDGWEPPEGYEAGLGAEGVTLRTEPAESEPKAETEDDSVAGTYEDETKGNERSGTVPSTGRESCLFLTWDAALCRRLREEGRAVLLAAKEEGLETLPWDIPQVVTEPFSLTVGELEQLFRRQKGLPLVIAETERLLIRETVSEDLEALRKIYREEQKNPYIFSLFGGRMGVEGLADYRRAQYEFYGFGMWSLCLRQNGEVIGRLGFSCGAEPELLELGYLLASRYRQKGYAKEAAARLLSLAKEQSWGSRVQVRTGTDNTASRRLAAALGFTLREESGGTCIYEKSLG